MKKNQIDRVWRWQITASAAAALLIACLLGVGFGPVNLNFGSIIRTLLGLPNGLENEDRTLLLELRLPRVVLGALVGAALATSGAVYQSVFRNPLADPYLLGVASGAGLGATIAITNGGGDLHALLPIFAFLGGVLAVAATFLVAGRLFADPSTLLLAGIAVGSFATAFQTYLQQRNSAALRPVYSWILGELTVANWDVVKWAGFYILIALFVLIRISKVLDALMLSDEEA